MHVFDREQTYFPFQMPRYQSPITHMKPDHNFKPISSVGFVDVRIEKGGAELEDKERKKKM